MTVGQMELSVRAHNLLHEHRQSPVRKILELHSGRTKCLGMVTFCEVTLELLRLGVSPCSVRESTWWSSAYRNWRLTPVLAIVCAAVERLFYIRNIKPTAVGNCALWWAEGGHGYTCDLRKAWRVDEAKAVSLCRDRPDQDVAVPVDVADGLAVLHVDVQGLR
jgi:hypothetical protein